MFVIYSKGARGLCGFCDKAEDLLESLGYNTTVINIMDEFEENKTYFLEEHHIVIKTVPQIVENIAGEEHYVGGYNELVKYLKEKSL